MAQVLLNLFLLAPQVLEQDGYGWLQFCPNAGNGCSGGGSAWGYFESTDVVTGGDYTDRGTGSFC